MSQLEIRPDRVRLENTNDCDDDCWFCPHRKMKRKRGTMSMKLFKRLADEIKQWEVKEIVIQGFGEPLTDELFFERVEYAKTINIPKIQTNVNSKYIDPYMANKLVNSGLTELFISCNKEGTDNVKYLLSLLRPKSLKIYLSYIEGLTSLSVPPFKADGVSISYPHNWGGVMTAKSRGYRDPCRLLWVTMYVTWEGIVHMCCMDYEAIHTYGDTSKNTLQEIWKNNWYRELHREKRWNSIGTCRNCSYNAHNKSPWWIR